MIEGVLLLRRGGATWGVRHGDVRSLVRHAGAGAAAGGGFEVTVEAGALAADEVLGVAAITALRPAGRVLRRFWPEAARGLAVHGRLPLVVIDPAAPPRALVAGAAGRPGAGPAGSDPGAGRPAGRLRKGRAHGD